MNDNDILIYINEDEIEIDVDVSVTFAEWASPITPEDEGKVVVNGEFVAQTSRAVTANATYDTTTNNSVTVAVSWPDGTNIKY